MEKIKNRKVLITILGALIIGAIGITYALVNLTLEGTKKQIINAGVISLELDEDENNLTIENALTLYLEPIY